MFDSWEDVPEDNDRFYRRAGHLSFYHHGLVFALGGLTEFLSKVKWVQKDCHLL